ncbi:alpha-N-acetylglucosaminidase [Drosophila grimshawi]|uniref:GH13491 n=1 Tax=Drosophila grimshawi TaxID=7222 RepID=B4JPC0_DROGR|nr:alpha-N-acetylglucosaminidase [Drosophila grimshawi]EDV98750.1 GH13491 [Drosophila grimshawi]
MAGNLSVFHILWILALVGSSVHCHFGPELVARVAPQVSPDVQEEAVRQLMQRVLGDRASNLFEVEVNKALELRSYQFRQLDNGKVLIVGWDGVSVCKGFHYYLKYVLNMDLDWFKTHIELPAQLQPKNVTHSSESASWFIYYQNVCTWSYSFVWWNFGQWRRHIDWMAMMGINLSLAPNQEAIWQEVYTETGLNADEIDAHFAGPAFQAWQRMGNIRGWGGPLPPAHRRLQQLLQQRIVQAQRDLGMSVALPAFAGHVPTGLPRIFPTANFTSVERWNQFPDPYCCALFIEPSDPLFQLVGAQFLRRVIQIYGSNHIYFSDPFNEMQPRIAEPGYISSTARAIYNSMRMVDKDPVWLLQGWMFLDNAYWSDELIEAFLTAVPRGRMLVLDLQSEQFPQYQRTFSYYGQPFVWCMLNNFGGTLGMFGSAHLINAGIMAARSMPNSSMVGVGITPEGIGQNYALFALTLEQGWSGSKLELSDWFDQFTLTRYGVNDTDLILAWQLLRGSVYHFHGLQRMRGKYALNKRPSFNLKPWIWYNASSVVEAWQLLLAANQTIPVEDDRYALYKHDLVDITRQFLQQSFDQVYVNLKSAYRKSQLARFEYLAAKLLELLADMERILASGEHYLLGNWLEAAKELAPSADQRHIYEFNARNQLTAWGPSNQILDYATKQWSGLMQDYYTPRWSMFLDAVTLAMHSKRPFNATAFRQRVANEIELPFSNLTKVYPTEPVGSTWLISQEIHDKWQSYAKDTQFLHHCRVAVKLLEGNSSIA